MAGRMFGLWAVGEFDGSRLRADLTLIGGCLGRTGSLEAEMSDGQRGISCTVGVSLSSFVMLLEPGAGDSPRPESRTTADTSWCCTLARRVILARNSIFNDAHLVAPIALSRVTVVALLG